MRSALLALCLVVTSAVFGQTPVDLPKPAREIPLYDGPAPGSERWDWSEATFKTLLGNVVTRNVVRPVLQYFPAAPARKAGTAVVIAPGGGFTDLMIAYSGVEVAQALSAVGIDAFILKYRLVYTDPAIPLPKPGENRPKPLPRVGEDGAILIGPQKGQNIYELDLADARAGVRWIREHSAELGLKPERVGLIGYSAGAVLAHMMVFDPAVTRPDFVGLIYGTAKAQPTLPADAPPAFIAVAADDAWAAPLSLEAYGAWVAAKRPVELHIYQMGGHGFRQEGGGGDHYLERFEEWMATNGWVMRPAAGHTD